MGVSVSCEHLPHSGHGYGRDSMCIQPCWRSVLFCLNSFWQMGHLTYKGIPALRPCWMTSGKQPFTPPPGVGFRYCSAPKLAPDPNTEWFMPVITNTNNYLCNSGLKITRKHNAPLTHFNYFSIIWVINPAGCQLKMQFDL